MTKMSLSERKVVLAMCIIGISLSIVSILLLGDAQ